MRPGRSTLALALLVVAMAGQAFHAAALELPVVDDAAISIAYGQSLFTGFGFRLTEGSAPVEGFSNPAWTVLLGLSRPFSIPPLPFARWLGIALGALALVVLGCSETPLEPLDALGAVIVATIPNYAYWISSGMESGLHGLVLALLLWTAPRDFRRGDGAITGCILGLLFLTRPEAPLVIAATAALWLTGRWSEGGRLGRSGAMLLGTLAAVAGGYLVFRWITFGRWLPNTYYAKRFWDFGAIAYLSGFASAHWAPLGLATVLGLLGLSQAQTRPRAALAWALIASQLSFIAFARGDWMGEWRFCAPLWPAFGALIGSGLIAVRRRTSWRVAASLGIATVAIVAASQYKRFDLVKRSPGFPAQVVQDWALNLQRNVRAHGVLHQRLGLPDIGGSALALRHEQIVDVAGLADYAVAEHANHYAAIEDYLVAEGLPDVINAHGPSGHLVAFNRLMSYYQREADYWILSGLSPGRDPRCPEGDAMKVGTEKGDVLIAQLLERIDHSAPEEAVILLRCIQAHRGMDAIEPMIRSLVGRTLEHASAEGRSGHALPQLRYLSLATVLSGEDAHLRRRTEALRSELFGP